jgi:Di-haem oxidoreductase, putative peroxidase
MNQVKSLATLSITSLLLLLPVAWAPDAKSKKVSSETVEAVFQTAAPAASSNDQLTNTNMQGMVDQGRRIFRYDTFGDEAFWGGALNLHQAIAGEKLGGVGPGVSPKTALSVGLKVDADALPANLVEQIKAGKVNMDDPATTLALLKLNSVIGVTGFFDKAGKLESIGIQCAFCHSTVDNSFAPGIGHRLDGWPNRDLNVGAIVSLSPNLQPVADLLGVDVPTVKKVLVSWGPGKYDAELDQDGKAFRPDGKSAAVLLPAAFGLAGVNNGTYTGWGSVTYWNAYVANTQMHGKGAFSEPLITAGQFPVGAKAHYNQVRNADDQITSKLAALQFYQLAIPAPKAPEGSYDKAQAERGKALFSGKANCASCHVPPLYTEPGSSLHTPEEIGIDDFQSSRSPTKKYRTTPLRGLWSHQKGGFYHDGRFQTLDEVITHYDQHSKLGLTAQEKKDLAEFLKSL